MVFDKTIREVVDENYVYARALHHLGIDFFQAPDRNLKEICQERGLEMKQVIRTFYVFDTCHRFSFKELETYPIELLTEYLKHSHHIFIKEKLPFIVHLAKQWDGNAELKTLLPEFVEDFIRHIYEEEDSTFRYIHLLSLINQGKEPAPYSKLLAFKNFSLKSEFAHHKEEDELEAIRGLMDTLSGNCLHSRVIISEIKSFDREMVYHAQIENNIFFPKALALEKEVNQKVEMLTSLN